MPTATPDFPALTTLPRMGSWPEAVHVWERLQWLAVKAALAAQRPLLLRGEPGAGKSQLARAAAVQLDRLFVSDVVHARSESSDLQYRYDAVARLGDAQALGARMSPGESPRAASADRADPLDHRNYLSPGPLWWVFDWDSAQAQHARAGGRSPAPQPPAGWQPGMGAVLLIDEIDKADSELPNGLLETLGNGAFSVPWLEHPVRQREGVPPALVVVTTNEERELPAAFLRRCLVLNLELPKTEAKFIELMVERGLKHSKGRCDEAVCTEAAHQTWNDRIAMKDSGRYAPGQAEYLDMLRVLAAEHPGNNEQQLKLLDDIKPFMLRKSGPDDA